MKKTVWCVFGCILILLLTGCNGEITDVGDSIETETDYQWVKVDGEAVPDDWSVTAVENEDYIFGLTGRKLIRFKKSDGAKKTIYSFSNSQRGDISFCMSNDRIYCSDLDKVWSTDFDGKNRTEEVTQKEIRNVAGGRLHVDIFGLQYYNEDIFLLTTGLDVFRASKRDNMKMIAEDVRKSCFLDNALYYIQRAGNCIYKTEVDGEKTTVLRKLENKNTTRYSDVFVHDDKLYYIKDQRIYRIDEQGDKEIALPGNTGNVYHVGTSENAFLICENGQGDGDLYRITGDTVNHIIKLPEDYLDFAGVVDNKFLYVS